MEFYERGEVKVDEHFVRFGSKAFAINKVNSVEVRTDPVSMAWLLFAIVGVLSVLGGMNAETVDGGVKAVFAGLVLAGIAFLMFRGRTRMHHLILMTSSSEIQAYSTRDAADIRKLREAIELAIVSAR